MKSKILTILTILLLFNIAALAESAEEAQDVLPEQSTGIQPNNPFYFLDKAMDKINLALTRNQEKKAKLELKIAEERLREVNLMIQKNKIETALKVQEAHQKQLEQLKSRIQDLKDTVNEETISELETSVDRQELLLDDIDASSSLPKLTTEDKAKVKEMIEKMKEKSKETREKLQERKQALIQKRPEMKEKLQESKEAKVPPEIQNRINMITKKIEISEKILAKRADITAETKQNLELAKVKLEEAKKNLEAKNYEEAKALTLEANKLAVLVRGNSVEAKEKASVARELALTREEIKEQKQTLQQKKEEVKNTIDELREKEQELLRERQQKIIEKKEQVEEKNKERTITNVENNKDVETATQQSRS